MHNNDPEVSALFFLLERTFTSHTPSSTPRTTHAQCSLGGWLSILGEPRDNNSLDQAAATHSRKVSVCINSHLFAHSSTESVDC